MADFTFFVRGYKNGYYGVRDSNLDVLYTQTKTGYYFAVDRSDESFFVVESQILYNKTKSGVIISSTSVVDIDPDFYGVNPLLFDGNYLYGWVYAQRSIYRWNKELTVRNDWALDAAFEPGEVITLAKSSRDGNYIYLLISGTTSKLAKFTLSESGLLDSPLWIIDCADIVADLQTYTIDDDTNGNLYISGNISGDYNGVLAKLSGVDGSVVWSNTGKEGCFSIFAAYSSETDSIYIIDFEDTQRVWQYDAATGNYIGKTIELPADLGNSIIICDSDTLVVGCTGSNPYVYAFDISSDWGEDESYIDSALQPGASIYFSGFGDPAGHINNLIVGEDDITNYLSVGDSSDDESASVISFPVVLSGVSDGTVSVDYQTSDGTAIASTDYVAASGTLSFVSGVYNYDIDITIIPNALFEDDKTFFVTLSNPVNAIISVDTGTGTILNDDPAPAFTDFTTMFYNNAPSGYQDYRCLDGDLDLAYEVNKSLDFPWSIAVNYYNDCFYVKQGGYLKKRVLSTSLETHSVLANDVGRLFCVDNFGYLWCNSSDATKIYKYSSDLSSYTTYNRKSAVTSPSYYKALPFCDSTMMIVLGYSDDYRVACFNIEDLDGGDPMWSTVIGEFYVDLAIDGDGNAYVTAGATDRYVKKYSVVDGTLQWSTLGGDLLAYNANLNSIFTVHTVETYDISGQVTNNYGGAPVDGVTMTISGTSNIDVTNISGYYSFTGLESGIYSVIPSKLGYSFVPSYQSYNPLSTDQSSQDYVAYLLATYNISGQVTDNNGALAGTTLTISGTATEALTNASGYYSFTGLTLGDYNVIPSMSGYTFVPTYRSYAPLNSDQGGQDYYGTQLTTYNISGQVTDFGGELEGVTLTISGTSTEALTNASGYYSFTGLSEDNYVIIPSMSGYTFVPTYRSYAPLNSDQGGQDYVAYNEYIVLNDRITEVVTDIVAGAVDMTNTNIVIGSGISESIPISGIITGVSSILPAVITIGSGLTEEAMISSGIIYSGLVASITATYSFA
jgi:hypothetical protein